MPRRCTLREETIANALHVTANKNLPRSPHVNLLAPDELAFFSLLQRESLNIGIAEFEIERHSVALDRSGVSCRAILPRLVGTHRPPALHTMRPAQVEIPVGIDSQRPLNHATRAVVFNRR